MRAPGARGPGVALWTAFGLVHAWLAVLGVLVVPAEAFHDVDLYRWWAYLAVETGQWPVLDGPWVYPAGALAPMLAATVAGTSSTTAYAVAWCGLVTVLDAAAVVALLRTSLPRRRAAVGWWLGFLTLLGPVAIGRLDAVVVPVMLVALLLALRRPAVAAALLTAGAWIKVAPGALLLPVVAAARRPWRDVVLPAAAVCTVVIGAVALGGGLRHVASFLATQQARGLQVESVAATPWVVVSLWRDDVAVVLDEALVTWQVIGPGTDTAARLLDVVLVLATAAVAGVLWWARVRGAAARALLPGALTLLTVLIVANKVGSPQFLAWLAAPLTLLVAEGARVRLLAGTALATAGLTQVIFPWGYVELLMGDPGVTAVLVVRNVLLVTLLVMAAARLVRAASPASPASPPA